MRKAHSGTQSINTCAAVQSLVHDGMTAQRRQRCAALSPYSYSGAVARATAPPRDKYFWRATMDYVYDLVGSSALR
jgi:hypothetical protein